MMNRWTHQRQERRRADEHRKAAKAEAKAERRKQPAEGDLTDPLSAPNPVQPVPPRPDQGSVS